MGGGDVIDDRRAEEESQRSQPEPALCKLREAVSCEQPANPRHEKKHGTAARPCKMGLPPVIKHLREIPSDDRRKRRDKNEHVGNLLSLGEREED